MRRHFAFGAILVAAVSAAALALPAASASAQTSLVQVSADPYTNPASQHATEVEPDTIAVGSRIVSVFQVARFTNGGANNIGWATSTDGGQTWRHGFMPDLTIYSQPHGPWGRSSDPNVTYDARDGLFIASELNLKPFTANPKLTKAPEEVSVSLSKDGIHWSVPVTVAQAGLKETFDKQWVTCDSSPSSPFYGNCYMEWDIISAGELVVMSTSTDGGLTWSSPTPTPDMVHGGSSEPVVQPDGTVIVPISARTATFGGLGAFRSTDGGKTWSTVTPVTPVFQHPAAGPLRGPSLYSMSSDASGRVYVTWPDCRFRSGCTSNDMVMTTSTDGIQWTPVTRIPIDSVTSTVDHLGGGLGIDPTTAGPTARLGLYYYFYPQADCTVATCQLEVGYISSINGGASWSTPQLVAGPMSLTQLAYADGYMPGDYIGTAVVPGGNAISVVAVGGIPADGQQLNEAMYAPYGGLPVTGGTVTASAAGAVPAARSTAPAPSGP